MNSNQWNEYHDWTSINNVLVFILVVCVGKVDKVNI